MLSQHSLGPGLIFPIKNLKIQRKVIEHRAQLSIVSDKFLCSSVLSLLSVKRTHLEELIDPLGLPYNGFCDFQIHWRNFLESFPVELCKSHSVSFVETIACCGLL